jgi:hypothetical protein
MTFPTVAASTMPLIVIPLAAVVTILADDYGNFRLFIAVAVPVTIPVAVTVPVTIPLSSFSSFASFTAAFAAFIIT